MIIDKASIHLNSRHAAHSETRENVSIRLRLGEQAAAPPRTTELPLTPESGDENQIEPTESHSDNLKALIVRKLFKDATGREAEFFRLKLEHAQPRSPEPSQPPAQTNGESFGMVIEHSISYQENEQSSFTAEGVITTRDGRTISFSNQLHMSREFAIESRQTLRIGDAEKIDPLVINFDNRGAQLSGSRIAFDLDSNGEAERIPTLNAGSAMLALDINGDDVINNGSELFGPNSGDGFSELARYDSDHNQFIDEADAIFRELKLLQLHDDGSQELWTLKEKNIGAIYLGNADTPFQLKTGDNKLLGEIAASGIYLNEQGEAGTVQQINFTA